MLLYLIKSTGEVVAVTHRAQLESALRKLSAPSIAMARMLKQPIDPRALTRGTKHTDARELPYTGYLSGVVYVGERAPDALAVNTIVERRATSTGGTHATQARRIGGDA
jgi:hypothetical protein